MGFLVYNLLEEGTKVIADDKQAASLSGSWLVVRISLSREM